jgi:hypothetical protein
MAVQKMIIGILLKSLTPWRTKGLIFCVVHKLCSYAHFKKKQDSSLDADVAFKLSSVEAKIMMSTIEMAYNTELQFMPPKVLLVDDYLVHEIYFWISLWTWPLRKLQQDFVKGKFYCIVN